MAKVSQGVREKPMTTVWHPRCSRFHISSKNHWGMCISGKTKPSSSPTVRLHTGSGGGATRGSILSPFRRTAEWLPSPKMPWGFSSICYKICENERNTARTAKTATNSYNSSYSSSYNSYNVCYNVCTKRNHRYQTMKSLVALPTKIGFIPPTHRLLQLPCTCGLGAVSQPQSTLKSTRIRRDSMPLQWAGNGKKITIGITVFLQLDRIGTIMYSQSLLLPLWQPLSIEFFHKISERRARRRRSQAGENFWPGNGLRSPHDIETYGINQPIHGI